MSEQAAYPRVMALLTELCELNELDRQLPLDLLLNVHRSHLRAPLLSVLEMTEALPQDENPIAVLKTRYPQVPRRNTVYGQDPQRVRTINAYYRALSKHNSVAFDDERVHEVSRTISPNSIHYPAFILYMLGFAEASRAQGLDLMELLLSEHSAISSMLLDLGQDTRPVQSE